MSQLAGPPAPRYCQDPAQGGQEGFQEVLPTALRGRERWGRAGPPPAEAHACAGTWRITAESWCRRHAFTCPHAGRCPVVRKHPPWLALLGIPGTQELSGAQQALACDQKPLLHWG